MVDMLKNSILSPASPLASLMSHETVCYRLGSFDESKNSAGSEQDDTGAAARVANILANKKTKVARPKIFPEKTNGK